MFNVYRATRASHWPGPAANRRAHSDATFPNSRPAGVPQKWHPKRLLPSVGGIRRSQRARFAAAPRRREIARARIIAKSEPRTTPAGEESPARPPRSRARVSGRRGGGRRRGEERGPSPPPVLRSPSLCDATQWCHLSTGEPREHASGLEQPRQQSSRLSHGLESYVGPRARAPPQAEERAQSPLLPCAAVSPAPSPGEAPALARAPPGDFFLEAAASRRCPIIRAGARAFARAPAACVRMLQSASALVARSATRVPSGGPACTLRFCIPLHCACSTALTHRDRSWSKTGKDLRKMSDAFETYWRASGQTQQRRTRWALSRASDWLFSRTARLVGPASIRQGTEYARHILNRVFTVVIDYLTR
ncbi:hypothetical protein HPB50_006966 [Hyalomma asiaticum]|uniref:Uncharacterized protein n=1 Tax=Hyalomma asiaticum TaxID=266040 RepID=A0ACB7TE08_HYAAI|nr:hypothetical protein HPB50_006966 [Hyalomma asiaticum]